MKCESLSSTGRFARRLSVMRLSDYESGQTEKERDGKAGRLPACISMLKRNYDEIGPVNTSDSESDGS